MRKQHLFILIIFSTAVNPVLGQSSKSTLRKIHHLEAKGHLLEAAQLHISMHDDGEREASIKAGMSLYKIGRYKNALYYFQHADSIGSLDQPDEIFGYFECLKAEKRYKDADELIRTHLPKNQNSPELALHTDRLKFYEKLMGYGKSRINSIPINTKYSEFGPTILDGWLYFESTRITKENSELHGLNNQAYFNLYAHAIGDSSSAAVMPKGSFGKPQVMISSGSRQTLSVPAELNKTHHDGPVYLTPEGKHMFFTTNWDHEGKTKYNNPYLNLSYSSSALEKSQEKLVGKIHLNIYYSTRENNVWSIPVSFPYNNNAWSNQHAFFDEKTGTLYYSSNMPGGMGGFDLWMSTLKGAEWTKPVNLGPNVNSAKNEGFPSLSPDGYLIFASNGWPGLGGLDLFVSEFPDQDPINLLIGLNTEMDDFGVVFIDKGHGYVVSNRNESVGDDDIFEFHIDIPDIIEYSRIPYNIQVVDAKTSTPISGTVVVTHRGAKRTLLVGTEGQTLRLSTNNAELEASAPGYISGKLSLKQVQEDGPIIISLQPELVKEPVIPVAKSPEGAPVQIKMMENHKFIIYFEFDKFNIRNDAAEELAKVALELLQEYGAAEVALIGHTDARGSVEYNQRLSMERVNMAKKWLINRGVDATRIKTNYYGEKQLAVSCNDQLQTEQSADSCLTPIQHQLNRRVEIEIMNVIKN